LFLSWSMEITFGKVFLYFDYSTDLICYEQKSHHAFSYWIRSKCRPIDNIESVVDGRLHIYARSRETCTFVLTLTSLTGTSIVHYILWTNDKTNIVSAVDSVYKSHPGPRRIFRKYADDDETRCVYRTHYHVRLLVRFPIKRIKNAHTHTRNAIGRTNSLFQRDIITAVRAPPSRSQCDHERFLKRSVHKSLQRSLRLRARAKCSRADKRRGDETRKTSFSRRPELETWWWWWWWWCRRRFGTLRNVARKTRTRRNRYDSSSALHRRFPNRGPRTLVCKCRNIFTPEAEQ